MPCKYNWKQHRPTIHDIPCYGDRFYTAEKQHLCTETRCKHYVCQVSHDNPSCLVVTGNHQGAWREVEGDKIAEGIEALWYLVSKQIRQAIGNLANNNTATAALDLEGLLNAMEFKTGSYRVSLNVLLDMLRTQ